MKFTFIFCAMPRFLSTACSTAVTTFLNFSVTALYLLSDCGVRVYPPSLVATTENTGIRAKHSNQ